MVQRAAPSACSTGTRQLFTSSPFISTEQEPHSPSPHPSLVPVRPIFVRSTSSRRSMGYTDTVWTFPFTVRETSHLAPILVFIGYPPPPTQSRAIPPDARAPRSWRGRYLRATAEWN